MDNDNYLLPIDKAYADDTNILGDIKANLDGLSRGAWRTMKRDLGIAQVTRSQYLQHLVSSGSSAPAIFLIRRWLSGNPDCLCRLTQASAATLGYGGSRQRIPDLETLLSMDPIRSSIFQLLSTPHAGSLRVVSRFCMEAVAEHPWNDEVTPIKQLSSWHTCFPNARAARTQGSTLHDDEFIFFHGIHTLHVDRCVRFTSSAASYMHRLHTLHVFFAGNSGIDATAFKYLYDLKELYITQHGREGLAECLHHLRGSGLYTLHWHGLATTLQESAFEHLQHLRELSLSQVSMPDAGFKHLHRLTKLSLHQCDDTTDEAFRHLGNMEDLSIEECVSITNAAFQYIPDINMLQVEYCHWFTDDAFPYLRSLHTLSLIECDSIKGTGFAHLQTLQTLELHDCKGLTDEALAHVPHVTTLDISGCSQLTDTGIPDFKGGLLSARLDECDRITDAALEKIAGARFLSILSCTAINGSSFEKLRLHGLLRVHVIGCNASTLAAAWKYFLRNDYNAWQMLDHCSYDMLHWLDFAKHGGAICLAELLCKDLPEWNVVRLALSALTAIFYVEAYCNDFCGAGGVVSLVQYLRAFMHPPDRLTTVCMTVLPLLATVSGVNAFRACKPVALLTDIFKQYSNNKDVTDVVCRLLEPLCTEPADALELASLGGVSLLLAKTIRPPPAAPAVQIHYENDWVLYSDDNEEADSDDDNDDEDDSEEDAGLSVLGASYADSESELHNIDSLAFGQDESEPESSEEEP